jgi:hypothetical protein
MFRARTAGAAPAVDRPVGVSRRQHRRTSARGLGSGAGLLARIVHLLTGGGLGYSHRAG